ncbi:MAG: hypothetical protein KDC48_13595 [Planctomycetes bacterium]|nr:hypothetical protein [Planctomycetota bacterium]
MVGLLIKIFVGVLLFAGSVVGGLAATGRLNHEGTANIPVLSSFFPAPPPAEGGDPAAAGKPEAAGFHGQGGVADASHSTDEQGQQEPQGDHPNKKKVGRSLNDPEPSAGDGHGGGHGEEPSADAGHGAEPAKPEKAATPPQGGHDDAGKSDKHAAERDFDALAESLDKDRQSKYAPGGFFTFDGMPSGLTPDQINEAWKRVEATIAELDRRRTALDLREQELQELADDIGRRQRELSRERTVVEDLHRQLDRRIEKFQQQVKLVRNDEVAALKKNAASLSSWEPAKAAQMLEEQWKTDAGQTEILKLLEFMDKDKLDEILAQLPTALAWDVMQKRMRVSKEATPSGPGR